MLCGTQQCSRLGLRAGWTPGKVGQCWVIGRHWTMLTLNCSETFLMFGFGFGFADHRCYGNRFLFLGISVGRVVHPVRADCEL